MRQTLAVILAGLGLSACEGSSAPGECPEQPFLITEQQEAELGAQVHAEITNPSREGGMALYNDTTVNSYVAALGEDLVAVSCRRDLRHQFFVLDTPEVNAFAVPGGYVYVTTALLSNMDSRAELAGVMGHEVGHVSAYHGARAMQTQLGIDLIKGLLLGEQAANDSTVDFLAGTYLASTQHSQEQELEADGLGVKFSADTGHNPWGLVGFFEFIGGISGESDPISDFLGSHPPPAERVTRSTAQINGLGIGKDDARYAYDGGSLPFSQIKARVQSNRRR